MAPPVHPGAVQTIPVPMGQHPVSSQSILAQSSVAHMPSGPTAAGPLNQSVSQAQAANAAAREASAASAVDRNKLSSSGPLWKNETSEETIKARKSAQRVILNKFRLFWPSEDEIKLASRAYDFERGEYEVS